MSHTSKSARPSQRRTAIVAVAIAAVSVVAASLALASSLAVASEGPVTPAKQEVCADLSTGHQSAGGATTYTITAPAGKLIVQTCVKAGSDQSGGGVVYQTYSPGVGSATITGPDGKVISHWSAEFVATTVYTSTKTVSGSQDICTAEEQDVTIEYTSGPVTRTSTESQAAADEAAEEAAQEAAEVDLDSQLENYPGYTKGACKGPTVYTGEATVSDTVQICTAAGSTVTISYTSGLVTRTSRESQEAADAAALTAAQAAAQADLAEQLTAYPEYTTGACTPPTTPPTPPSTTPPTTPPSTPAASAPATVAPVLPATVETATPTPTPTPTEVVVPLPATVEEPETGAVPMPATVPVPTSVPAGDGSSAQRSSLVPWGLLVAGLIGLVGSAVARVRRQTR